MQYIDQYCDILHGRRLLAVGLAGDVRKIRDVWRDFWTSPVLQHPWCSSGLVTHGTFRSLHAGPTISICRRPSIRVHRKCCCVLTVLNPPGLVFSWTWSCTSLLARFSVAHGCLRVFHHGAGEIPLCFRAGHRWFPVLWPADGSKWLQYTHPAFHWRAMSHLLL